MARASKKQNELIHFKGTTLPVVSIALHSLNTEQLAGVAARLFGESGFFDGDLALLELDSLTGKAATSPDWLAIRDLFSRHGLRIIGVNGGTDLLRESADAAGLPSIAAFKRPASPDKPEMTDDLSVSETPTPPTPVETETPTPVEAETPTPVEAETPVSPTEVAQDLSETPALPAAEAPSTAHPPHVPTQILDRPLRSGQQFYARGSDLVILAPVSAGAEVIADGSIHIYAPLRGRALAGANGEASARIFTTRFEAELVSIAGVYRTFDAGIPAILASKPAQVQLRADGESLDIHALKTN